MALRLAAVSASGELAGDLSAAADPRPCISYRDSIRSVSAAVSGGLLFQSVHSASASTWSSSSYASDCSSHSSGVSAAVAAGFRALTAHELREIARRMVADGYAERMVQAFDDAATVEVLEEVALERWFFELDVDWVLRIREGHGLRQLEKPAASSSSSSLQDLVERWIRALIVMVHCVSELDLAADERTPALARFGEACIAKMVGFIDAVLAALRDVQAPASEKLHALVSMYGHAMDASSLLWSHCRRGLITHQQAQTSSTFDAMENALFRKATELHGAISSTMEEAKTLVEADDDPTWEASLARGSGGEQVHANTRLMVDCVASLGMYKGYLYAMIDDAIGYLRHLIRRKSKLCPDTSTRYIFLLNNSHFVAQQLEPFSNLRWIRCQWGFTDDGGSGYIDGYFNASWAPVLSCLSSKPGRRPDGLSPWSNKSSPLRKFELAFHETYKAQKLWKVPSPELRGRLRKTVIDRVVSGYREYLEEHPDLSKKLVSRGNSNTPADLEEMLGELFEG